MKYLIQQTGNVVDYDDGSDNCLINLFPNVNLYPEDTLTNEYLSGIGVLIVLVYAKPTIGYYQKAIERLPALIGNQWVIDWDIVDMTDEEKALKGPEVISISASQIRKGLLSAGLLDQIESLIAASGDRALQIDWEFSTHFENTNPHVQTMGSAIGKTPQQIDDLFRSWIAL